MVYIYKKIIGEKPYYYLRISQRKGDRVIAKDIAYLGNSIEEVKENLPKYSDQVKKAYKTINNFLESNRYLEKAHSLKLKKDEFIEYEKLLEIEACKLHFNSDFKNKNELTKNEILKNFVVEFAYNTTSIEGNTIKLDEVRSLLQDGLTPKDKTLREIYDLQNTERVFFSPEEKVSDVSIKKIHSELLKNIDTRTGYRIEEVRVIKANFKSSPAPYIKADIDLLLKWLNENKNRLHPLALAAIFHHKFEKIHPFMDGNGRTGRMLLNIILTENNYPPLIILKKDRKKYLDCLRTADKTNLLEINGDYKDLINFIADQMIKSYWMIFL